MNPDFDEYLVNSAINWCAKYGVSVRNKDGTFKYMSEVLKKLSENIDKYDSDIKNGEN